MAGSSHDAQLRDPPTLRWLHLSDFHFHARHGWQRQPPLPALLRHAAALRDRNLGPDLVFVTGDVAASGQRREYEQAERFLTRLAEVLDLEPARAFFLVPGNHDVNRRAIGPVDARILAALDTQEAIGEVLHDGPTMTLLGRRLAEFYAFTERFLGPDRAWRAARPWRCEVPEIRGLRVGVMGLNSAWAAGPHDAGRLLVGEAQVRDGLAKTADAVLRIVLVHHPIDALREIDRERLETLLGAPGGAHFLLRGHLHRTRTLAARSPDGVLVELAAGAVHTGDGHPQTHLLTAADLGTGRAETRFFRYSSEGRGFWTTDTESYEQLRDGVWAFELPRKLKRRRPPAEPPAVSRAPWTARYRTAAAAVHGTVRFVGFADRHPRPHVRVPELFVPLRFAVRGPGGEAETWETRDLLQLLVDCGAGGSAARLVVLGCPGSGKTTLCRFATALLAGETSLSGVSAADRVLPLFLPLRDYVHSCEQAGNRSFLEFLGDQARHLLQVAVSDGFLETALEEGRAVLLVDGLDEVGAAARREEMRQRLQAFCRLYPRVPVLVTSRTAGYREAPLPWEGRDAFRHLYLAPFNDDDLATFAAYWHAVREPDDAIVRERRIADLTAALGAEPRIRELARNPMLATLIALVQRHQADLPGERTALFDLCVKTLLASWPAARGRRFDDLDEDRQRWFLEAFALRMQRLRDRPESEVMIDREELVAALIEIGEEKAGRSSVPAPTRAMIERWVEHLTAETGLLVEQRPGILAFAHLSLMEYLAAGGLIQAGPEPLAEAIAELFQSPSWNEVCVLAVARRATDRQLLDRLYRHLVAGAAETRWSFLLRCLREEADFDEGQRTAIVRGAARRLLDLPPWRWRDRQVLDEVERFSARHGAWTAAWAERELATASGERLQAAVAIRHRHAQSTIAVLGARADAAEAAAALLDFWPASPMGRWAAETVAQRQALDWALDPGAEELLVLRSVAAVASGPAPFDPPSIPPYDKGGRPRPSQPRLAAPLLVALTRSAARLAAAAQGWTAKLADRRRPRGRGLPFAVLATPGHGLVAAVPRSPLAGHQEAGVSAPGDLELGDGGEPREFAHHFSFQLDLSPELARHIVRYHTRYVDRDYPGGFSRFFTPALTRDFARDFARDFGDDFTLRFLTPEDEAIERYRTPGNGPGNPELGPLRPDADLPAQRSIGAGVVSEDLIRSDVGAAVARQAAEAWVGLVSTVDRSAAQRRAYVRRRLVNGLVLILWPTLDAALDEPSPDVLALYLGLGWAQATTTWQWPATARWIALLGGEPPSDWLPRSQWHLCWLLSDPDHPDHRRALDEAVREGLDDDQRPQIAAHLRRFFPERGR